MNIPCLQRGEVWLSSAEFARMYGRCQRSVRMWCSNGTLAEFGIQTYKSNCNRSGEWWIKLPA